MLIALATPPLSLAFVRQVVEFLKVNIRANAVGQTTDQAQVGAVPDPSPRSQTLPTRVTPCASQWVDGRNTPNFGLPTASIGYTVDGQRQIWLLVA
jgi:hypothetical protein